MIDTSVRPALPEPADAGSRKRVIGTRITSTHVVMVVAGLLAFVLTIVALRDRDRTTYVAVAATDIDAGATLVADQVEFLTVNVEDAGLVSRFIDGDEMQARLDHRSVAARSIPAGEVILDRDLRSPDGPGMGLRTMSLEVPVARAVAGRLAAGDRIDVLMSVGDSSAVVAESLEVVSVATSSGLGGGAVTLTVAIDGPTALRLAGPSVTGELVVVRSTGSPPLADAPDA